MVSANKPYDTCTYLDKHTWLIFIGFAHFISQVDCGRHLSLLEKMSPYSFVFNYQNFFQYHQESSKFLCASFDVLQTTTLQIDNISVTYCIGIRSFILSFVRLKSFFTSWLLFLVSYLENRFS